MSGMIAAGGPQTAAAGQQMLARGGNAVDAAVAAAFASFIAEVGVVHLGGSGIAQIFDPVGGVSQIYDFFSNTPGLGRKTDGRAMDFEEVTIDFGATTQSFHLGRASVAVPGNIFGLCRMAADHGRLPLATLLEPALDMARAGIAIEPFQAQTCDLLRPLYTHTAGMRRIFAPHGRLIQAGERLFIPDLAATLEQLAAEGAALLRHGRLAQALLDDQAANGGLLTTADLAQYAVLQPEPIRLAYRGFEVRLPPLSSTGGVLTAFTLKLLAHFEVATLAHGGTRHLQLLYEIMAATNRARPNWERASAALPAVEAIARFLADEHISRYADEVATAVRRTTPGAAPPEPTGASNTSHLSVIDGAGMMVSLTTTAGESAGYVVPGTGFIPNNIMGEEDLHPAGFHSRPAGERIATMMTPVVVLQDGQPRLVVGSGGSIRIRSAILQVLSNLLDFGLSLDTAVNTARVHLESGALQCEAGYDPAAVDELEALGYRVNRWPTRSIYFGGAHSVSRTPDGTLVAAGDSRRGGATARAD